MTPIEENAQMVTDLDCQWHDLRNILHFYPVPGNLVRINDPRLSDPRTMLPGSVINESVSNHAAIVQSKLNLNGVMPPAWFAPPGPPPDNIETPPPPAWAARGDLAELLSRKGVPNGYAAVDNNLRLLPENVTPGPGLGTVSEVLFSFPSQFSDVAPSSGAVVNYNITWKNVPDNSWFGIVGYGMNMAVEPQFQTDTIPEQLFPELSASKFTTGLCVPETLPVAQFGQDHAPGVVPDPGEEGDIDEYLARDMTYRHFDANHFYQSYVPEPVITVISQSGGRVTIQISCSLAGSLLFYRSRITFNEIPNPHTIEVIPGTFIEAYAAKEGYNNSGIASFTVPGLSEPDLDTASDALVTTEESYGY